MTAAAHPSLSLAGKRAIVTGASRGIGRGVAQAFAAAGADVAVLARNEELLDDVADEVRVHGGNAVVATADVLDPEAFRAALARCVTELGGVDILINNAGGNSFSRPLLGTRFSGWDKTIRLNLDSVVHACQQVMPAMVEQGSGSVVNMSSVVALSGAPFMSHYGAAKSAVVSVTQSLAIECAGQGVRVNALLPGWIDTDLTDFLRATEETAESVLSRVPMHRWGTVSEIAAACLFLAGDASAFMTGQSLVVDGGMSVMP